MIQLGQAPTYSDHMAGVFDQRATTATTAAAAGAQQPALGDLLASMQQALAALPPDPLAQQMAADGYDPSDGGVLILPAAYRAHNWGPFGPPRYVRFSASIDTPTYGLDHLPHFINPLKEPHDL